MADPEVRIEVSRVIGGVAPLMRPSTAVFIEVSRVIGDVTPLMVSGTAVFMEVSRVIGSVALSAGPDGPRTRIEVQRVVGDVSPVLIGVEPALRISIPRLVGYPRIFIQAKGSLWNPPDYTGPEPYLPLIELDGYTWTNQSNLIITDMASGVRRQRRRYKTKTRSVDCTLNLNCVQLENLEEFLGRVGSSWFRWPVITGQSGGVLAEHIARIVDTVDMGSAGDDLYEVTLQMEVFFE